MFSGLDGMRRSCQQSTCLLSNAPQYCCVVLFSRCTCKKVFHESSDLDEHYKRCGLILHNRHKLRVWQETGEVLPNYPGDEEDETKVCMRVWLLKNPCKCAARIIVSISVHPTHVPSEQWQVT